jgi:hypothetical protein
MITNLTALAAVLQTLFLADAEELARTTNLVQRKRKLTGPVFAQTLVFGWLARPRATLEEIADFAFSCGTDVSFQAINDRITDNAVAFFAQLLCRALDYSCKTCSDYLPLLERFEGVFVFDTTDVALPDSLAGEFPGLGGSTPDAGRAGCGILVCLELSGQGIVDLQVADARTNDLAFDLAHTSLPKGALRLADLGFFNLELLDSYQEQGIFYVSRWKPHVLLFDENGCKFDLIDYLRASTNQIQTDRWIYAGEKQIKARLVAVRLSAAAAERRKRQYSKRKQKKGKTASEAMLALCEWDVTITNVPVEKLSVDEVVSLRRMRWQIELLFKAFKSVGGLDEVKGRRRERVLVELYAKLVGQVVQSWQLLVSCGSPVRWSWYRCGKRLQQWWVSVVVRMGNDKKLVARLREVARRLRRGGKKQTRKKRPAAFQSLLDPYEPAFANGARFPDESAPNRP